ncbi:MAG TPA: hypothetical protein VFO85_01425, partial [Vicinamibacteria bacterium]|nr:hypothetical protein [Vicinamibacteria bacterium]
MRVPAFAARVADVLAFTTFLAVPLAAAPAFWDQFVSVKWYVLEVLAAAWLAAEAWAGGGQPAFVRRHWMLVLTAAVLALASTLRMGP